MKFDKSLELIFRYGDIEVKHTFDDIGGFEEALKLSPVFGVPPKEEIAVALSTELLLRFLERDQKGIASMLRVMVDKLVTQVEEKASHETVPT